MTALYLSLGSAPRKGGRWALGGLLLVLHSACDPPESCAGDGCAAPQDLTSPASDGGGLTVRVKLGPQALTYCDFLPPSAVATIVSDPPGVRCGREGTACEARFPSGTAVSLRGDLQPGAQLLGWIGPCGSDDDSKRCVVRERSGLVQLTANLAVTSALELTVKNTGGGGYVEVSPLGDSGVYDSGAGRCGGSGMSACCALFSDGAPVRLRAVYGPMVEYHGMSGACQTQSNSCSLTIKGRSRVTVTMPHQ